MNITLTRELQERIGQRIQSGDYANADELVQQALNWFLEIEDEDEEGLGEIKAAIGDSVEQSERGRTMSLEEFDQRMRAKYGIPR